MRYLYFTSTHCVPCKALKPKIEKHKSIEVIDVEKEIMLANKYGVMNIPTILVLDKNDVVQEQIIGASIEKWLIKTFKK